MYSFKTWYFPLDSALFFLRPHRNDVHNPYAESARLFNDELLAFNAHKHSVFGLEGKS